MFEPPRCPFEDCSNHRDPAPKFFYHHGVYKPRCRPRPVPRFFCKACERTFSRQTFRADYWDKKPHQNEPLMKLLVSGVGLRQSGRMLPMARSCVELKARKLARHAAHLNLRLRGQLPEPTCLQLDEIETYEGRRRERPLTMPIILEPWSRFLVWGESAPLAPKGRMSAKRLIANQQEIDRSGPRIGQSNEVVRRALQRAAELVKEAKAIWIETDEKTTYPKLIREAFRGKAIHHSTVSSELERDVKNPLFPINQMEAIARDLMGRLRRNSWLVSKKRCYLDLAFQLFMAWKNYVRPRFNGERETPAQLAGFVLRKLTVREVLGWRQDWGGLSMPVGKGVHLRVRGSAAA